MGILTSHCGIGEFGPWGVSVFLVLSGFLMLYSYYDKDVDSTLSNCFAFAKRKIGKLYPLHIVTMLGALFLAIIPIISQFSFEKLIILLLQVILNVFCLQSWIPEKGFYFSLNWVAWYLSVIAFLYFSFPLILNWFKRRPNKKRVIIASSLTFLLQIVIAILADYFGCEILMNHNFSMWMTYICPLFRLGDFFIGCCFGYYYKNRKRCEMNSVSATAVEFAILCFVIISNLIYIKQCGVLGKEYIRNSLLFTPSSVLLVWYIAYNRGYISRFLTCKAMVYLGDISACGFLVHQIIIRYLSTAVEVILSKEVPSVLTLGIALIGTIICAEIWMKIMKSLNEYRTKKTFF